MSDPIGKHNIGEYLTAFADGELGAAQILTVLDYLAEHRAEGLELLRTQQHLRVAAGRAVRTLTPPVPDALRRQIQTLAQAAAGAPDQRRVSSKTWRETLRGPLPGIAAGLLVTGMLVGWALAPRAVTSVADVRSAPEPLVPARLVAHASLVHADCSRLAEGLHAAAYPTELAELSAAVRTDTGGENPYPDFRGIGYEFVGAGPCGAPLRNTVHLLYYSTVPGRRSAISVFVQPHAGQFALQPDKLYQVSDDRSPFPMFAWRTSRIVYFLVADTGDIAAAARGAMTAGHIPAAVAR